MAISWVIPVRVVQAVLALIVLALTAYGTSIFVGIFFFSLNIQDAC